MMLGLRPGDQLSADFVNLCRWFRKLPEKAEDKDSALRGPLFDAHTLSDRGLSDDVRMHHDMGLWSGLPNADQRDLFTDL